MERFIATWDLHYGHERRGGHKVALHDPKAWGAVMKFAQDFKPQRWIHGGDMLDCGVISHHNARKPGRTEGLKLLADAEEGRKMFILPVEALTSNLIYIVGNHEAWLEDVTDEHPALEGIIDLSALLHLQKWKIIPQGHVYNRGKLTFAHGDQIKGGEHVAKAAVISYERSIRFGHHHTAQLYTKTSPLDYKLAKTGMAVPCLCTKDPKYGEGKPNRWMQGFLYGYFHPNGWFNDYMVTILDGKFVVDGRLYRG